MIMTKQHAAKVFGYVDPSKKERIARLRKMNSRLTESRLVEEGLDKALEFYEAQLHPMEPIQRTSARQRKR